MQLQAEWLMARKLSYPSFLEIFEAMVFKGGVNRNPFQSYGASPAVWDYYNAILCTSIGY